MKPLILTSFILTLNFAQASIAPPASSEIKRTKLFEFSLKCDLHNRREGQYDIYRINASWLDLAPKIKSEEILVFKACGNGETFEIDVKFHVSREILKQKDGKWSSDSDKTVLPQVTCLTAEIQKMKIPESIRKLEANPITGKKFLKSETQAYIINSLELKLSEKYDDPMSQSDDFGTLKLRRTWTNNFEQYLKDSLLASNEGGVILAANHSFTKDSDIIAPAISLFSNNSYVKYAEIGESAYTCKLEHRERALKSLEE